MPLFLFGESTSLKGKNTLRDGKLIYNRKCSRGLFTFSSGQILNKWIHRNDMHAHTRSFPLSTSSTYLQTIPLYAVNTISRTATFKNKDLYFVSLHGLYLCLLQEAYRDTWVSTRTLVNSSIFTYGEAGQRNYRR